MCCSLGCPSHHNLGLSYEYAITTLLYSRASRPLKPQSSDWFCDHKCGACWVWKALISSYHLVYRHACAVCWGSQAPPNRAIIRFDIMNMLCRASYIHQTFNYHTGLPSKVCCLLGFSNHPNLKLSYGLPSWMCFCCDYQTTLSGIKLVWIGYETGMKQNVGQILKLRILNKKHRYPRDYSRRRQHDICMYV